MAFSDNENDYFSDTYNDDISTKDQIINDLKKLSNKNDIKALRQYIIINRRKLKDYKTRLLNDVVGVKGYKFMRRDGKLIMVKISPSSKYYKPEDNKAAKSEYAPLSADFESVASYADIEGFSEAMPPISKPAILLFLLLPYLLSCFRFAQASKRLCLPYLLDLLLLLYRY